MNFLVIPRRFTIAFFSLLMVFLINQRYHQSKISREIFQIPLIKSKESIARNNNPQTIKQTNSNSNLNSKIAGRLCSWTIFLGNHLHIFNFLSEVGLFSIWIINDYSRFAYHLLFFYARLLSPISYILLSKALWCNIQFDLISFFPSLLVRVCVCVCIAALWILFFIRIWQFSWEIRK